MKQVKINTKNDLNDFLRKQKHVELLQSWEWGEFQKTSGNNIYRIGVEEDGQFLAVATLIEKNIGLGKKYFYSPRGPVFDKSKIKDVESILFNEIKKLAKEKNVIFLRFEPRNKPQNLQLKIYKSISLQPEKTLMLDLERSEDELLKVMHQKTRYNIRLAKKKGVEIVEGKMDDFDKFWELINKTSDRDGFRIHSREHYRKLLDIDFVKIYFAKFEDKFIATGLFSFFGDTVTYMHGASSNDFRNVMSPFLLQWFVMKEAKEKNYKYYDFYGIDENKWPGVTRFKKGFGGFEKKYPGTLDMVFNSMWYNGYKFLRKLRRMI